MVLRRFGHKRVTRSVLLNVYKFYSFIPGIMHPQTAVFYIKVQQMF